MKTYSVYVGNPARRISSIEEHHERLKSDFEHSAYICIQQKTRELGRILELNELGIYASLFVEKTDLNMQKYFGKSTIQTAIRNMQKKYNSVSEFIENYTSEK